MRYTFKHIPWPLLLRPFHCWLPVRLLPNRRARVSILMMR